MFEEAFWVTVGTVAPVIGLGHAVVLGRHFATISEIEQRIASSVAVAGAEVVAQLAEIAELKATFDVSRPAIKKLVQDVQRSDSDPVMLMDQLVAVVNLREQQRGKLSQAAAGLETSRTRLLDRQQATTQAARVAKLTVGVQILVLAAVVACCAGLTTALLSLAWHREAIPQAWATGAMVGAMVALVVPPAADEILRRVKDRPLV